MIALKDIERARAHIPPAALDTPLVRLLGGKERDVWLKLENLSPIGSFKLRGVHGALARIRADELATGLWTVSAGNFGRALAWVARQLEISATVLIPDEAPLVKEQAIRDLGAAVERAPLDELYAIMEAGGDGKHRGYYVDPVGYGGEAAGYGTIGLELAEQLGEIDTVLVPWGSGGLACGIASALAVTQPDASVHSCEPHTGAALASSMEAGRPLVIEYTPSFVDAAGGKQVFPHAWELARHLIRRTHVVTLDEAAAAIRYLATHAHVIAEGAGALPVAVALSEGTYGRTVCVVSGGNIDASTLATILGGVTPGVNQSSA